MPPTTPPAGSGSPPPDLAGASPGDRFGKFVRTEKLGAGGMGEVWKAWDTELARWVALKFLRGGDEEELARFVREAQVAGKLSHPNIAAVHETGQAQGRHFIAMQYVDGRTLKGFPRKDRRALATIVRDAARAVAFAHEQGVVHRDIKPENLMAMPRGHVYVMDFGLARAVEGGSKLSVSGLVVGTPAYMPPEQARGEKVDARADVYSLGATLYELLTGRAPFTGGNMLEILSRVAVEEPAAPRTLDPTVDADLETITLKCLEKEPSRRYDGAGRLADDLDRWLSGDPIAARPASLLYRVRKRLAKHRAATLAVAAAAVLALVSIVAIPRWLAEARAREGKERELAAEKGRAEALQELGRLWMEVVLAKQDLHKASIEAARARSGVRASIDRVGDFIRRHPRQAQGYHVRAHGLILLDEFDAAQRDLDQALLLDGAFAPARLLSARLAVERRVMLNRASPDLKHVRHAEQRQLLEQVLRTFPSAWTVDEFRRRFEASGLVWTREDEALCIVLEALRLAYEDADLDAALALLGQAGRTGDSEEFPYWVGILGDRTESGEHFAEAIRRMPHHARAHMLRGMWFWDRRDAARATEELDTAIAINDGLAPAYWCRGLVGIETDRLDAAFKDLTRAIELDPKLSEAHMARGWVLWKKRALDEAVRDLSRAIDLQPDYALAYDVRAMAYEDKGLLDEALADYAREIQLNPSSRTTMTVGGTPMELPTITACLLNRAELYERLGRLRDAEQELTSAILRHPGLVALRRWRADVRERHGDVEGAAQDRATDAAREPDTADACIRRGEARRDGGDVAGAIEDFSRALAMEPGQARTWDLRGHARLLQREYAQALEDFNKSIEFDATLPWVYANRARALELLAGERRARLRDLLGAAVADLEKALDVAAPDWPRRNEVEADLRRLRALLNR